MTKGEEHMTDEEIHNIYLHMSGKAEGLVEATGKADFPVLFARAILEYEGMTKDVQNMASKSTYKEQLETKDDPVAWEQFYPDIGKPPFEYWNAVEGWVKIDEVREHFDSVGCGTIYKTAGEDRVPMYTTPQQRTWVGLTDEEIDQGLLRSNHALQTAGAWRDGVEWATKQLREKNNE